MEPRLLTFDVPNVQQGGATHRMACHEWGDPHAARTLLCVHGLTRNGRDFDFLARALSANFRVLCPDIPGRGVSEWLHNPLCYSNPVYVADVIFMLQVLKIAQVYWLGTSMGGIMGILTANGYPGLIKALILNDVGCLIPSDALTRIGDIAAMKTTYPTRAEAEAAFRQRTVTFGITDEIQWRHLLTYGIKDNPDGSLSFTYDPAIFANCVKTNPPAPVDLWSLWEAVTKIPVLLIRGARSDLLLRETAIEMQSRHPRLTLHEVTNAGHAPSLMDGKEIALIQNWISAQINS